MSDTTSFECHCGENFLEDDQKDVRQKVCLGLTHFGDCEGKSYCVLHFPGKDKSNEFEAAFTNKLEIQDYNFQGVWFPTKVQFPAIEYKAKVDLKYAVFAAKAKFKKITFTAEAIFDKATFLADVTFENAIFISEAKFYKTKFSAGVYFKKAQFKGKTSFQSTIFSAEANFDNSSFDLKVDFDCAKFLESSEIFFKGTRFKSEADFKYVVFAGYVLFKGEKYNPVFLKESFLNLRDARLENPERISFHTVRLEPSWFIDTDASEFNFTACRWRYGLPKPFFSQKLAGNIDELIKIIMKRRRSPLAVKMLSYYKEKYGSGKRLKVKIELKNLRIRRKYNPHALLTKTCWQLSLNHEENKSFPKASMFRKLAQESKRLEDNNGWKVWSFHWWYWLTSFYGESSIQAGIFLLLLLFAVFPVIYTRTEFQTYPPEKPISISIDADKGNSECIKNEENCNFKTRTLNFWNGEAVAHSLTTATLQNVDYRKPATVGSELWIILEKILVPLQAALLALAIRRKFMR